MSYRTDRQRVAGLGSAKAGTEHFWSQRVFAVALVPLTVLFVFPLARNLGADHASVLAAYKNPFNAIVAILFMFVAFNHLRLGVQTVIEDYIHGRALNTALQLATTLICWALALSGIFAVAKIAFSA